MSTRVGVAALILVLAGCSAPQAANPARAPGPSAPPLPPASQPPTVTPQAGLAALKACELLTAQEASSLGMRPQGQAEEILGLRRCAWTTPEGDGLSTGINEKLGIDGLNLADVSRVTDVAIGRHRAKRSLDNSEPGYCEIIFAVGDTANVSVLTLYPNDTARACAVTDRAAVLVESKLP